MKHHLKLEPPSSTQALKEGILGFANLGRAWENEKEQKMVFFDSHKVSRTAVITPHFTDEKIEPQCRYWPKATWLTSDGGVDSKSSGCQGYKRIGPSP